MEDLNGSLYLQEEGRRTLHSSCAVHVFFHFLALPPVAQQGRQHHQAVLHHGDFLGGLRPSQQQFSAGPEGGKAETLGAPLRHHVLQLGVDVPLLHRADANVLMDN